MSIHVMSWAKKKKVGDAKAKAILLALADYANHEAVAWPSIPTLTEETELSRSSVIRALAYLEDAGWITRTQRVRATGNTSNEYLIKAYIVEVSGGHGGSVRVTPERSVELPEEEEKNKQEKKKPDQTAQYVTEFAPLWKKYPSRGDKGNPRAPAFANYVKLRKAGESAERLLAAVERYAETQKKSGNVGTGFVLMASTFFGRDRRWEEYADMAATPSGFVSQKVVMKKLEEDEELGDLYKAFLAKKTENG